jgi:hypothetical protein
MHSRSTVGSPTSASSTALRVNASASLVRNAAAAIVVLLRQPIRRRGGVPDRPLSNGRPASAAAVLVLAHQSSASPWSDGRTNPAAAQPRNIQC